MQTFQAVEMELASNLKHWVLETADSIDAEAISAIARKRQASHWASPSIPGAAPRKQLHAVYEALIKAAEFFELQNAHALGFETSEAKTLFARYEKTLFRFDKLYRLFSEEADKTLQWNILKSLREEIERVYANWFGPTLAPRLAQGENRRAYVVISDAFRFEADAMSRMSPPHPRAFERKRLPRPRGLAAAAGAGSVYGSKRCLSPPHFA